MEERGEIVMYQPDSEVKLEVRLEDETVWLTQAQMAMLFQTTPQNVTIHIRSIYKEGELDKTSTCNLDVIISVGYRVKSKRGTQFRIWANKVLKEYLLKGYRAEDIVRSRENCFWSKPDLSTTALRASGQDDIARDDRVGNIRG